MKTQTRIKKNMTTSKAAQMFSSQQQPPSSPSSNTHECCMCGDYGFSYELFQCKLCRFRLQHRYCSNLYPNLADSHRSICNWCLTEKDDMKDKSQNSSSSDSIIKNISINPNNTNNNNNNNNNKQQQGSNSTGLILRRQGGGSNTMNHLQVVKYGPIKKQKSVEILLPSPSPSPSPSSTRKRMMTKEERLRRTRSEDISNASGIITKQVFRNKVRRYKLLDEVSS